MKRHSSNEAIIERYANLATSPENETRFEIGAMSAKSLGYDCTTIDALPTSCVESFAGVGNPLALGQIDVGESVADFGSGAGLDALIAATLVGESGSVIGFDCTPAMIAKSRANAKLLARENVRFEVADLAAVPMPTGSVDVVISNGVFNLCEDKAAVAAEMHRILKSGGRLQIADMVLEDHVSHEELAELGSWSD